MAAFALSKEVGSVAFNVSFTGGIARFGQVVDSCRLKLSSLANSAPHASHVGILADTEILTGFGAGIDSLTGFCAGIESMTGLGAGTDNTKGARCAAAAPPPPPLPPPIIKLL